MRDHSQLNGTTPVISGGLANVGSPQTRSFNKQLTVSIPDTIEFLRRNGSDRLVDGLWGARISEWRYTPDGLSPRFGSGLRLFRMSERFQTLLAHGVGLQQSKSVLSHR